LRRPRRRKPARSALRWCRCSVASALQSVEVVTFQAVKYGSCVRYTNAPTNEHGGALLYDSIVGFMPMRNGSSAKIGGGRVVETERHVPLAALVDHIADTLTPVSDVLRHSASVLLSLEGQSSKPVDSALNLSCFCEAIRSLCFDLQRELDLGPVRALELHYDRIGDCIERFHRPHHVDLD